MPEEKNFLDQFSNSGKPASFEEEKRIPVSRERKPVNWKLLVILLVAALLLGVLAYFLFLAPKIVMPDFAGKAKSDVAAWVKQQGIEPSGIIFQETYDFDTDEGTILTQSIPAGKKVRKDVKLNFDLSLGPDPEERIKVPDFYSMDKESIQEWISKNKLLGKAVLIKRGSRTIDCESPKWIRRFRWWNRFWKVRPVMLFPFRVMNKCERALCRIKKK